MRNAPIVSIDLCILKDKKILLGKRFNPPAKNCFFVPGGRIRKNESINKALERIINDELALTIKDLSKKTFLGVYQHFYSDNFLGSETFNSHYIVLCYCIEFSNLVENNNKKIEQHSEYIWYSSKSNINFEQKIHKYTKEYFKNKKLESLLNC